MPPKVLLVSNNSCYPLFAGGALAQYYFIDGLRDEVEFVLCTVARTNREMEDIELLQKQQPKLNVYVCDLRPVPAKVRKSKLLIRRLYNTLKSKGKTEYFNPIKDDFADSYFSHVDHAFPANWLKMINDIIEKENIKVVQYDFYDTIDIVQALPDDVIKIFVEHEVRFKRLKLAYGKSQMPDAYKDYLIKKTEDFERLCASKADVVVVFNDDDACLLKDSCKRIVVSPFAIPDENVFNHVAGGSYNKLLFVGGESHTPNLLGLQWFLDEIYIPNANVISSPLFVVGDWSGDIKEKYSNCDKVIFTGRVPSIEPWFDNAIFVNPILSGAGIRTKVLHAMVNGVPVMSTRFGAEGCYTEDEKSHLVLFDTAEEFIEGLKNSDFQKIGELGKQYYNTAFNKDKLLNIRKSLYE